jgi:predicted Zn-dependent protease
MNRHSLLHQQHYEKVCIPISIKFNHTAIALPKCRAQLHLLCAHCIGSVPSYNFHTNTALHSAQTSKQYKQYLQQFVQSETERLYETSIVCELINQQLTTNVTTNPCINIVTQTVFIITMQTFHESVMTADDGDNYCGGGLVASNSCLSLFFFTSIVSCCSFSCSCK